LLQQRNVAKSSEDFKRFQATGGSPAAIGILPGNLSRVWQLTGILVELNG
jgi:hypothetical protein